MRILPILFSSFWRRLPLGEPLRASRQFSGFFKACGKPTGRLLGASLGVSSGHPASNCGLRERP
eukprot:912089-Pyramimonas_sp.AAC.1